jgi:hypothetical protein
VCTGRLRSNRRVTTSAGSPKLRSEDLTPALQEPRSDFLERRVVLYSAVGVAVALGLAFRAIQYAADRSLWLDESMLALNLLHRSAAGLTQTLDYAQAAPLGFLELEKLATHAFGDSELALRGLPLICGLASVPLFAALALRLLRSGPALLATLVFACAAGPVYYASEAKQYSGDIAAAIALTLLAVLYVDGALSGRAQVVASLAGAAAMLLSHASVFVAGGIVLALAAHAILRRDRKAFVALAATVPWLLTGVFIVVFTSARTSTLATVIGPTSHAYGHGPSLLSRVNWIRDVSSALLRSIGYPQGAPERYLHWPLLALAVLGAVGLARRRALWAAFLLLPFALTWVASALDKYPVFDRTVLFLVPATVLFLVEGAAVFVRAARSRTLRVCVGGILAAAVLLVPLVHASERAVHPVQHEEMKKALEYIRRHWQPGDALFVDREARFALRYYLDCKCLSAAEVRGRGLAWRFGESAGGHGRQPVPLRKIDPSFVVGRLNVLPTTFAKQLHGLEGRPRVWILYTHLSYASEAFQIAETLGRLDRRDRRLSGFDTAGAHAYLYDLRPRSP